MSDKIDPVFKYLQKNFKVFLCKKCEDQSFKVTLTIHENRDDEREGVVDDMPLSVTLVA